MTCADRRDDLPRFQLQDAVFSRLQWTIIELARLIQAGLLSMRMCEAKPCVKSADGIGLVRQAGLQALLNFLNECDQRERG